MTRRLLAVIAAFVAVASLAACTDDREPVLGPTTTTLVPPTTAPPQTGTEDCGGFQPTDSYLPFDIGAPGTRAAPGTTMRAIQDRDRLIVGVSADTLLFGARDPITGKMEGVDIDMLREVGATLNNRSFVALTISGMFMNVSLGLKQALELYFNLYFWGLTQGQLAILTVTGVVASVIGSDA